MKPKLLTLRQQVGIFNTADPIAVMREYVSFSKDVLFVAQRRLITNSLEQFAEDEENATESRKQLFQNLSEEDAGIIYFKLEGHIYPEVLIKMLDTFPKEVSKELLLEYAKYCPLKEEVMIRAISVLGNDAREIILKMQYIRIEVFNKIFRVFGKEELKKILVNLASIDLDMDDAIEAKIIRIYSGEDLKEILKAFIANDVPMHGNLISKIFDVCSTKEEIEELLNQAIANDMDIWYETLDRIIEYFPKDEAKRYLDTFFEETSPGRCEYRNDEKEEYYKRLFSDEDDEEF